MKNGQPAFEKLDEALNYLYGCLPYFERDGKSAYKPSLDNTLQLLSRLGNPHIGLRCIHVAGTNGKGSVSHIIASVLQAAGYKTGLYTSPHLVKFTERIKVDGQAILEDSLLRLINETLATTSDLTPSFFEYTTAMAFRHFANVGTDIAVIETGLGGHLDSTNVILPLLSVITNIGMDHTELLGNTMEAIAGEKAGIIKPTVPVIIGQWQAECAEVFIRKSEECASRLTFADRKAYLVPAGLTDISKGYQYCEADEEGRAYNFDFETDLTATYQQSNLITAIVALKESNLVESEALVKGLRSIISGTSFKGRWQVLGRYPLVLCDTAHNPDGMRTLAMELSRFEPEDLHIVVGMVADKDVSTALKHLPAGARYYFAAADTKRALSADALAAVASACGLQGSTFACLPEAFAAARNNALAQQIILVCGSNYLVGELLALTENYL